MRILCKRGGRKKDIPRMDFIQRFKELSIYLWLWTRSQEPSTSKANIRIHKSSPALSLCLSLAEHTTFKSAPRFLLVRDSGLQEPAEEKPCMAQPQHCQKGAIPYICLPCSKSLLLLLGNLLCFPSSPGRFNKLNLEQLPTGWTCVRIWVSRKAWLQKFYLRLSTKLQRPCKKEKESSGSRAVCPAPK